MVNKKGQKLMELLKPNGRIVSGLPCIYHTPVGMFFTEAVHEDDADYIFDPDKTVHLILRPDGQCAMVKGFASIVWQPSTLRSPRGATVVTDCTDAKALAMMRQVLSGIVLAGSIPPGEKVH